MRLARLAIVHAELFARKNPVGGNGEECLGCHVVAASLTSTGEAPISTDNILNIFQMLCMSNPEILNFMAWQSLSRTQALPAPARFP